MSYPGCLIAITCHSADVIVRDVLQITERAFMFREGHDLIARLQSHVTVEPYCAGWVGRLSALSCQVS